MRLSTSSLTGAVIILAPFTLAAPAGPLELTVRADLPDHLDNGAVCNAFECGWCHMYFHNKVTPQWTYPDGRAGDSSPHRCLDDNDQVLDPCPYCEAQPYCNPCTHDGGHEKRPLVPWVSDSDSDDDDDDDKVNKRALRSTTAAPLYTPSPSRGPVILVGSDKAPVHASAQVDVDHGVSLKFDLDAKNLDDNTVVPLTEKHAEPYWSDGEETDVEPKIPSPTEPAMLKRRKDGELDTVHIPDVLNTANHASGVLRLHGVKTGTDEHMIHSFFQSDSNMKKLTLTVKHCLEHPYQPKHDKRSADLPSQPTKPVLMARKKHPMEEKTWEVTRKGQDPAQLVISASKKDMELISRLITDNSSNAAIRCDVKKVESCGGDCP